MPGWSADEDAVTRFEDRDPSEEPWFDPADGTPTDLLMSVEKSSEPRRRQDMSAAQQQSAPLSRMTVAAITKGRLKKPRRVVIHGPDGVGKTTFAANAPKPIFLGTEDGTEHMDVARFPSPQTWTEVLEAVRELTESRHDFESFILDTLDWAEPFVWKLVCQRANVATIEEVGGGYGKGYQAALDEWRIFVRALERLQTERGMHVVLLGHSLIKTFKNPQGDDFDRYIMQLNEKAAGLLRQWANGVYFANYETFAVKDKAKRVRGVSTGARILYTQRTAAFDAKDRYGLPDQLPLSWADFERAAQLGQPMTDDELRAAIAESAAKLAPDIRTKVLEKVAGLAGGKLVEANNWVAAQVAIAQSNSTPTTQSKEN